MIGSSATRVVHAAEPTRIAAEALKPWNRPPGADWSRDDWHFVDVGYTNIGYNLVGDTAVLPPKQNPFLLAPRPPWAK